MRKPEKKEQKITLNMTPMIDIVFMLLAFFIMTFKIVAPEGDFDIKMPFGPSRPSDRLDTTEPIRIKLTANSVGDLVNIEFGDKSLGDNFNQLRAYVYQAAGGDGAPNADNLEIELVPDEGLRYEYTIDAMTAVSGYAKGGKTFNLVDKVRFGARPKTH